MLSRPLSSPLVALCALAFTVACGGKPAPASPAPPAAGSSEAPAPVAPPLASAAHPDAPATPTASAASAAPAAPATPAIVMDDPSGCTAVATAFEHETHPKIRACYREGKKDDPNLEGTLKVLLTFDARGKRTLKTEDVTLPKSVATCMLQALEKTPFPEGKRCLGKTLTFPIRFPSR